MCGIAGWLNYDENISRNERVIEKMWDTLRRRGPDSSGKYIEENVCLLHRRLAVVDIKNGNQPMIKTVGGKTYIIVYNGELYNTNRIREALEAENYEFEGHSDTEVLLYSYIEWGERCVERFNGIYAFAIYDKDERKLFFARDRAGVKPFFYNISGRDFVFGSEIKTLLENPCVSRDVSREGVAEVFLIGPGRTPGATAFCDVEELCPGWCGTFTESGLSVWQYWKLEAHEHTDSFDETCDKIRFLLEDSISRQLVSDVPLCCFLSGGLDSSIISSVAARKFREDGREKLVTYSVDYVDNDKYFQANSFQPNRDDYFIDLMVNDINSDHRKVILDNKSVANALDDAVLARDLPGMADVDSSLLLFCRAVKHTHTVVLSGECSDEIFGGYPWYHNPKVLNRDDFPWGGNTELKAKLISSELLTFDPNDFVRQRYLDTINSAPKLSGDSDVDRRIREMYILNINWFMQTLLDRKDRMSMYSGLEVRVPFCDHRILEYAYNIPWDVKSCGGREKGMLRRAFSGILPDEITERKKSPYPKTHNPVYMRAVTEKMKNVIKNPASPIFEIADRKNLESLVESGGSEFKVPWYGQLMDGPQILAYMYMINSWMQEYKVNIV